MSLDLAIAELETAVEAAVSATPPIREGSAEWYIMRTQAMGLSFLRRVKQLQIDGDHGAVERLYRKCLTENKHIPVPPAVEVPKEIPVEPGRVNS